MVEIESVLNRIAACEREKDELYSRMRFQAQQREQEKRPYTFSQELEESKAKLKGLTTALEFIQAEQEILVERVLPIDEQQHTLESLNKVSRSADQRMVREIQDMNGYARTSLIQW